MEFFNLWSDVFKVLAVSKGVNDKPRIQVVLQLSNMTSEGG